MSRPYKTTAAAAVATLGAAALPRPAAGAMALSSLPTATVQALIDLGSDGATAGDARYFDFSYAATANAPAAADVRVQSVGMGDSGGLRFVASWLADNGSLVSSTIGYDVASLDGDPISAVGLLSNGTAPVPGPQTFVTATASAATGAGSPVAPILSTYDDGRTVPTDTTAADTDSASATLATPRTSLGVTDTLTVVAGRGGLATASFVQNGFTFVADVPEPAAGGLLLLAAGLVRRRRPGVKPK